MKRLRIFLLSICSFVFCFCAVLFLGIKAETKTVSANVPETCALTMKDGASVRLVGESGLRFGATISKDDYDALQAKGVTFHMVIMPYDYVTTYGDISDDTLYGNNAKYYWNQDNYASGKVQIVHMSTNTLSTFVNGVYEFRGALLNIKPKNYEREFYAKAYYTVNGVNYYAADNGMDNVRSISYVAQRALAEETLTEQNEKVLTAYSTQFKESGDTLDLYVADAENVESVKVDATDVSIQVSDNMLTITDNLADGRHTATIIRKNGKSYQLPFVVADYVIRTAADVENWNKSAVSGITGGSPEEYVVLANNIDCTDVVYAPTYTNFYGVFDGYGHALTNLVVGTTNLGGTRTSSSFIGGTLYGSVKDLALVNVHFNLTNGMYDAETGLCGRLESGLIENCYVSGIVTKSGTCRRAGLISALEAGGTVRNCIVDASKQVQFDNFYAVGINGDDATTPYSTTFENVLAIAPESVLVNKAENAEITKVSPEGDIASAFESFIASAGAESGFSYDEETGWLSLWNTQVYKIAKEYTLEVQFADNEDITFTTEKTVTAVKVDGTAVSFTQEGDVVRITSAIADGRHTLVMGADGDNYTMPFVVADYVIRTAADVENWQDNVNCGDGGTYVVLANDIDCASVQNYAGKATTWYGVFDGYGHAISNLTINTTTITYYSEVVPCATFIGRYGREGSVVRDFALVNVTYNLSNGAYDSTAGIIGHMEAGLIENCFVSGRVEEYTGTWRKGGYLGGQLNGNIKNVVVIDLSDPSTAVPVVGHMDNDNNTTNVLAVTNGNVLANGLGGITQITKVSPEGDIASAFESFIASAGAESGFSYDEETGWLSLWNTQVYKIAKEYTLEVQFADNEDITFTTEKTVTAVKVDGTAVSFTQEGDVVRITSAIADGRHTLVMGADGDNYTMPFVVADYVIRTAADVENWNKSAVSGITGGSPEEYVVLANNIDCTDVVYAPTYKNFWGVFDGYGHALTNLVVGTANLGGNQTSSTFIGGTNYGTIKDLALVNVHFNLTNGMYDAETGLCGRLERGLIENCYVSGIVTKSGTCRRAGLISALEAGGTVRNCIVDASKQVQFDNFYAVGINGDDATTPYSTTFENVLAIAPESVLVNKADNAEITKVLSTDNLANAYQTFIANCGENSVWSYDETTGELKLRNTLVTPFVVTEYTEYSLVKDGMSEYVIVVPDDILDGERMAAEDFQMYFAASTGVELPIISDVDVVYTSQSKYISIGRTTLVDMASVTVNYNTITGNGFALETVGQSLFIIGGSDYGSVYGVQRVLNELFDFEMYAIDEVVYDVGFTDVVLPEFHTVGVPDVPYFIANYGFLTENEEDATRLGFAPDTPYATGWLEFNGYTLHIGGTHNLLTIVPYDLYGAEHPTWFSENGTQLCLSNEEMYTTAFLPTIKAFISNYPDAKDMALIQMDVKEWCTCADCTSDKELYGSDAGNLVVFANKVAKDIREWMETEYPGREVVRFTIMAYHCTELAPQLRDAEGNIREELIFEENLFLQVATVEQNCKDSLKEGDNAHYYTNIIAWSEMAHTMSLWTYETCFVDYLTPFNNFSSMQENMQIFEELNIEKVYSLGQWNLSNSTDFAHLKAYLNAKLAWETEADYNALIEDFFANYYKDAGDAMLKLFKALQVVHKEIQNDGYTVDPFVSSRWTADYWKQSTLNGLLAQIDNAYNAIRALQQTDVELYNKLYDRICLESLSFRFCLLHLYWDQYSVAELLEMRTAFKADAERLGIDRYGEGSNKLLSDLYAEWGIA